MDFEVGRMDENDSERNIFFAALLTAVFLATAFAANLPIVTVDRGAELTMRKNKVETLIREFY